MSGDIPAVQVPCNLILSGQSNQGQQKCRIPKLKDSFKSKDKMFVPTDGSEDDRRPNPGELKEGLAELRASQASEMSSPARSGEKETHLGTHTSNSCQGKDRFSQKAPSKKKNDETLSTVP